MKNIQITLLTVFIVLCEVSAFGQGKEKVREKVEVQDSLGKILASTKSNDYIAVEGYYVDNSSFMVIRSSDVVIDENVRYPVYAYKHQMNLYDKTGNCMAEIPAFVGRDEQGAKCLRVLFLNKKRTNKNQLTVDDLLVLGMPILGDSVRYVQSSDQKVYQASCSALRSFLFNQGAVPQFKESSSTQTHSSVKN